jgi:hypothetical protein
MADILPPAPIDAPFASYNWTDWYKKVRDNINNAATSVSWTIVTDRPTTVAGYGISDAVTINTSKIKLPAAVTNGAAAALGTLANAPVVGNPTKWLAVDDNGTTRYIPAW